MRKRSGFSLIELVVVVAIIAVLSASVMFFVSGFLVDTEREQAENFLYSLASATRMISKNYGDQTEAVRAFVPAVRLDGVPVNSALNIGFASGTYLSIVNEYFDKPIEETMYFGTVAYCYFDSSVGAIKAFFPMDEENFEVYLF